jgi:hypothetical protein
MLVAREARNRSRTSHAEQTGFLRGLFARTFCAGLHPVVEKRRFVHEQLKAKTLNGDVGPSRSNGARNHDGPAIG